MPTIAQLTPDMLPDAYALLCELDSSVPHSSWHSLFHPPWAIDDNCLGYALLQRGTLVGMIGTLFSERTIAGKDVRFCNMHCWYVKPEFRSGSLMLVRPLLNLKQCTLTDLSASPAVCEILGQMGFSVLDQHAVVMPPTPWMARRTTSHSDVDPVTAQNVDCLSVYDQQIYLDHQHAPCGHLLIRDDEGTCYLVYSRVDKHVIPFCQIHYISDPARFARHHQQVRKQLMSRAHCCWVVVDSRLLRGASIPYSFRIRANDKLYRSQHIAPDRVDNLYSEMPLLGLSTLLSGRARALLLAKTYLPASAAAYVQSALQTGEQKRREQMQTGLGSA